MRDFKDGLILGNVITFIPMYFIFSYLYTPKTEPPPQDPITIVYNKDCYVEYDDRELQVKPITIQDLGEME